MRSETNLNLCSLFILLINLCAHKYRNSTRVKKLSFIVSNFSLVYDFEALCWIFLMYVYYLWIFSIRQRFGLLAGHIPRSVQHVQHVHKPDLVHICCVKGITRIFEDGARHVIGPLFILKFVISQLFFSYSSGDLQIFKMVSQCQIALMLGIIFSSRTADGQLFPNLPCLLKTGSII